MKILYIANIRLPTEKAHGLQIMKTCEAFADYGNEVTLMVTSRKNPIKDDPFEYYKVRKNFKIVRLWSWDLVGWGRIGFLIQYTTFTFSVFFSSLIQDSDIVYGRDELTLLGPLWRSRSVVAWESHVGAWNSVARLVARRVQKIITISQGLKDFYVEKGVSASKILVAHDGVDLSEFTNPESQESARKRLGLPLDKKIAMYIGRLDGYKGSEVLCEAAAFLPEHIRVVLIGGEEKQVALMRQKYPAVMFLGYHPYRELKDNQAAADVLVIPNSGMSEISSKFTSPLKVFSAMASGKPIVASDLPSIREVLSEECAYFSVSDNPKSLSDTIITACKDPGAEKKGEKALEEVVRYTWQERVRSILSSIQAV